MSKEESDIKSDVVERSNLQDFRSNLLEHELYDLPFGSCEAYSTLAKEKQLQPYGQSFPFMSPFLIVYVQKNNVELIDSFASREVVKVTVCEAHLVTAASSKGRPENYAVDRRIKPNGQAQRRELVNHSPHKRPIGLIKMSLQPNPIHKNPAGPQPPQPLHVGVHRGLAVAARLHHVELVHEKSGQRVDPVGRREQPQRRRGPKTPLVEVEVEHLVADVPVNELAPVVRQQAPDPVAHGRPEIRTR
ncbi:type I iodothyronine deiodinase [Striga asiatica]|uniref:Type I iodothyronine deiodinase n=1 Tax=Striga asiatica TaxID=4170 RepID=A0A5A7RCV2_STRAF|nr:type I iodothyronine deiodinase [Striga asiatica]